MDYEERRDAARWLYYDLHWTLAEIGFVFGITGERARQVIHDVQPTRGYRRRRRPEDPPGPLSQAALAAVWEARRSDPHRCPYCGQSRLDGTVERP